MWVRLGSLASVAFLAFGAAAGFADWWPHFQASVAAGDAQAVAQGMQFPISWENGPIREIRTREDFVAHFASRFPADMRRAIATVKPERLPNGQYIVTWKARGNEYSLYFDRVQKDGAFRLSALSEGPP